MTAAIPPACCAGADDGTFLTKLDRLRHVDRGSLAVFPARRIQRGVRAIGADLHDVHIDVNVKLDFHIDIHFDADVDLDFHLDVIADVELERGWPGIHGRSAGGCRVTALPDRLGFQRRLDQRRGQAALQPDDHQPRARHGAAGDQ
jgi:hypothetical protein